MAMIARLLASVFRRIVDASFGYDFFKDC